MFLDPGPEAFDIFAADASGLVFRVSERDTASFSIAHVVEDSPADKAEVHIGDILVAVDGQTSVGILTGESENGDAGTRRDLSSPAKRWQRPVTSVSSFGR